MYRQRHCVYSWLLPQRDRHNLGYADRIATIVSEVGIQGCSIVGINHKVEMRHDRLNGTPVDVWHGILKVCCVVSVDLFCTMWTYHSTSPMELDRERVNVI